MKNIHIFELFKTINQEKDLYLQASKMTHTNIDNKTRTIYKAKEENSWYNNKL